MKNYVILDFSLNVCTFFFFWLHLMTCETSSLHYLTFLMEKSCFTSSGIKKSHNSLMIWIVIDGGVSHHRKKPQVLMVQKKPQLTHVTSCSWWRGVPSPKKKSHKSYSANPTLRYNFLKQKPVEPDPPCLTFCNFYLHLHAWRNNRHREKNK